MITMMPRMPVLTAVVAASLEHLIRNLLGSSSEHHPHRDFLLPGFGLAARFGARGFEGNETQLVVGILANW